MVNPNSLVSVTSFDVCNVYLSLSSREVFPESKVTLEICEIHTVVDRSSKSQAYTISDVKDQTEATIGGVVI